jgi:hypothetical protein
MMRFLSGQTKILNVTDSSSDDSSFWLLWTGRSRKYLASVLEVLNVMVEAGFTVSGYEEGEEGIV